MAHIRNARSFRSSDPTLDSVKPIARVSLHEAVLNQVRDMIIEGKLPPGSRINESQVGVLLGVSRTPLREAIKTLASEGLIDVMPAKGAVVRRFSTADIGHILEALKVLEQSAARMVCAHGSAAHIDGIKCLHIKMLELYRKRDRLAYFKLNQDIHSALVHAAGNPVLSEVHEQLQARIKRIRFIGNDRQDGWDGAVADHEVMIEALGRLDGEALAAAVGAHLDRTLERIGSATNENRTAGSPVSDED